MCDYNEKRDALFLFNQVDNGINKLTIDSDKLFGYFTKYEKQKTQSKRL